MKKSLLIMAAFAASAVAFAQNDVDITPAGYDFSTSNITITQIPAESPWNNWNVAAPKCFDNAGGQAAFNVHKGLIVGVGPNWKDSDSEHFQELLKATSYVDLGGEVGRVLCLYGKNTNLAAGDEYDFNTLYGTNIPHAESGTASGNLNFFMDPANTPTVTKGAKQLEDLNEYIHVRMVLNVYDANVSTDALFGNIYCVNNDGSQNPNTLYDAEAENHAGIQALPSDAPGSAITCDEFKYDDDFNWDPTQWLVYEFDTFCPGVDENGAVFSPLRLKVELSEAALAHCTVFIKEVKFFKRTKTEGVDIMPANVGRKHDFITLNCDITQASAAVENIRAIQTGAKTYDLSGREVSNAQNGVFVRNGKKVVL